MDEDATCKVCGAHEDCLCPPSKSERRKARKLAASEGRPWSAEQRTDGAGYEVVRGRTPAQERKHERAMERWARRSYEQD